MRRMGFAEQWVTLIMMCVRTVNYAVLVNGNPVGQIYPSREIRQGDLCRASLERWKKLTEILRDYERASGQRLNRSKTAIFFSRNTPTDIREKIVEVSGIPSSQSYDTYLGLPALVGKSRTTTFQSINERVWKRLQDWKLKFLS